LNLLESAQRLGALRAVELACFRRLGERSAWLEPAGCARWAGSASRAHSWRASLIEELLPVSVGLPSFEELTVIPGGALGDELGRILPEIGLDSGPATTAEDGRELVVAMALGLYPRLVGEYTSLLQLCTPACDGAVARIMTRALGDLETVRAEGVELSSRTS
jgi:hypothetical protein